MTLTRREFMIAGGAVGALATRSLTLPQVVLSGAKNTDASNPRIERFARTLCGQCHGGCGLQVRIVNRRAVGISGNPLHPINRGGLCARASAAAQTLYNPDRLRQPMVLSGPKGSGAFRPIGWTDAVNRLAARLVSIRQGSGPQGLAVIINGDRGLRRALWERFLQAYGSNNLLDWSFLNGHTAHPALRATQGVNRAIGYDLSRARYVLSFGSQWLDAHWSATQASESFASMRSADLENRAKVVHLEARLSLTGIKANEWIPIRPGTEGALALGLAHVLLRENLYDQNFVEHLTHGFDDPPGSTEQRLGFRRLVLRDYSPAQVAQITGVEEGTIFRLAREFATLRPAVAIGYDGPGVSFQRSYDRMAIHALNALVGSLDVPGGVTHFQTVPLLREPMPPPDEVTEQGLAKPPICAMDPSSYPLGDSAVNSLADRMLANFPHPIEAVVLDNVNPVFDTPFPDRMKQALGQAPFVVSLSPWMNDSARCADLIIPDLHFLERWDFDYSHTLTGEPVLSIGQPIVQGPADTKSTADLLLELARSIGDPVKLALPYESPEQAVRAACSSVFRLGRGTPFGTREDVGWTRVLERGGWRSRSLTSESDFYAAVQETGGWTDPIYHQEEWDRVFRSPPRRFAFHSVLIAEHVRPRREADDLKCLPHYEPIRGKDDTAFPLRLYLYPLPLVAGLNDANVPWLLDVCGAHMGERWTSWVEINPETARSLHIHDGDAVVVSSPRGALRLKARLYEGIMPEVVAIPWGLGHEDGGRWSDGVGANPATIIEPLPDAVTSEPYWNATSVSVRTA